MFKHRSFSIDYAAHRVQQLLYYLILFESHLPRNMKPERETEMGGGGGASVIVVDAREHVHLA